MVLQLLSWFLESYIWISPHPTRLKPTHAYYYCTGKGDPPSCQELLLKSSVSLLRDVKPNGCQNSTIPCAQIWPSCVHGNNIAAQKWQNFADFVQHYCSQFGTDGCHSQRKSFRCKSNKIKHHQKVRETPRKCTQHRTTNEVKQRNYIYYCVKQSRTTMPVIILKWKIGLEKVRRISAEFTKMARRICKLRVQNFHFCTEFWQP